MRDMIRTYINYTKLEANTFTTSNYEGNIVTSLVSKDI